VHPHYLALTSRVKNSSLAAGLITTAVGITLIVPSVWVTHSLFNAAIQGIDAIVPTSLQDVWQGLLAQNPRAAHAVDSIQRVLRISDAFTRTIEGLSAHAQYFIGSSIRAIFHAVLTLFVLFFLLRDGAGFVLALKKLLPLSPPDTEIVLKRIDDTIHAAFFGMVAVAILQGFLGALLLWWLQLPGVVVWGTIMALLALVPYLGAFVVWIPVACFLILQDEWYKALITVIWGLFVIGLADNLLYPYLVGKKLHYHSLVVFFFLLGGVMLFGAAGVVLGPVLLATTERILWVWQREPLAANTPTYVV
jgi:predicted PurR-regulated permease PerM